MKRQWVTEDQTHPLKMVSIVDAEASGRRFITTGHGLIAQNNNFTNTDGNKSSDSTIKCEESFDREDISRIAIQTILKRSDGQWS